MCQQEFDHKTGGIGDPCQKKRAMFVETSYLLLSVNIEYRLKQSIPIKIAGCLTTGSKARAVYHDNSYGFPDYVDVHRIQRDGKP